MAWTMQAWLFFAALLLKNALTLRAIMIGFRFYYLRLETLD